jgi:uncharacterized protein (TIGR02996 family)
LCLCGSFHPSFPKVCEGRWTPKDREPFRQQAGLSGTMMSEAQFLAAIEAAPDDVGLRLIYADWLEEQGRARAAARERRLARYGGFEDIEFKGRPGKWQLDITRRPRHASWKDNRRRQRRQR